MQVHFDKIFSELYSGALRKWLHSDAFAHTYIVCQEKKNLSLTAIKLHKMTHYIRAPEIMPTQVGERASNCWAKEKEKQ